MMSFPFHKFYEDLWLPKKSFDMTDKNCFSWIIFHLSTIFVIELNGQMFVHIFSQLQYKFVCRKIYFFYCNFKKLTGGWG